VIPPISVGAEKSNTVRISVSPQSIAVPGEADIFITAEADTTRTYVQAQILYTVKTYRAVATRQPRWSEPESSGVETLVEVAGEEKNYDALLNGKAYNVIERLYAFFPQQSGELSIAPARFEARVLQNGRITGRKVFRSKPTTVVVDPIPPPPVDYPNAVWFPAKTVELSQQWSRDLEGLRAGQPVTRHIKIVADGQLETQIPVMASAELPNIRVYPDKPELRTVAAASGVRAIRNDQYTLIATQPGTVKLPEMVLTWWDINNGEWKFARLPATILNIAPSENVVAPPKAAAAAPDKQPDTPATETRVIQSEFWQRVSGVLLISWLLTLLFWWRSSHKGSRIPSKPALPPIYKQQARYLKVARKAALSGDARGVKSALLAWGKLQWQDDAPRNLDNLARRVSMPLSVEIQKLCNASYGPDEVNWDGESLAKALRSFAVLDEEVGNPAGGLPPLLPDSAA